MISSPSSTSSGELCEGVCVRECVCRGGGDVCLCVSVDGYTLLIYCIMWSILRLVPRLSYPSSLLHKAGMLRHESLGTMLVTSCLCEIDKKICMGNDEQFVIM